MQTTFSFTSGMLVNTRVAAKRLSSANNCRICKEATVRHNPVNNCIISNGATVSSFIGGQIKKKTTTNFLDQIFPEIIRTSQCKFYCALIIR